METSRMIHLPMRAHPTVFTNDDAIMDLDKPETRLCQFLALPGEIRNQIYQLLLTSAFLPALRRLIAQNHCSSYVLPPLPIYAAVLATCKQINIEATPILYTLNTFTASPTRLTALPFLVSPSRPITAPGLSGKIRRWYVHVRLDCDAQFSEADATKAFSGADEVEIEASQAMYRSAGNGVLMLFKKVRGVGRAVVHGSCDRDFAEWLQGCMMGDMGSTFDEFDDGVEMRVVDGVAEVFDIWRHANR